MKDKSAHAVVDMWQRLQHQILWVLDRKGYAHGTSAYHVIQPYARRCRLRWHLIPLQLLQVGTSKVLFNTPVPPQDGGKHTNDGKGCAEANFVEQNYEPCKCGREARLSPT